jgi:hypothetical protein
MGSVSELYSFMDAADATLVRRVLGEGEEEGGDGGGEGAAAAAAPAGEAALPGLGQRRGAVACPGVGTADTGRVSRVRSRHPPARRPRRPQRTTRRAPRRPAPKPATRAAARCTTS